MVLSLLSDAADAQDAMAWAQSFGLTYPVLVDPGGQVGVQWEVDWYIPTFVLLGTGAVISKKDPTEGISDSDIQAVLPPADEAETE